jgi:hypothetical protein
MNLLRRLLRVFGILGLAVIITGAGLVLWAMPTTEERMCHQMLLDAEQLLPIADGLNQLNDPAATDAYHVVYEHITAVWVACPIQYSMQARRWLLYLEGRDQ